MQSMSQVWDKKNSAVCNKMKRNQERGKRQEQVVAESENIEF